MHTNDFWSSVVCCSNLLTCSNYWKLRIFSIVAQRCEGDAAVLKELSEKPETSSRITQHRRPNRELEVHPFLEEADPDFPCTGRYWKTTVWPILVLQLPLDAVNTVSGFRPPVPRDVLRSVERNSSKRVMYYFTYGASTALGRSDDISEGH